MAADVDKVNLKSCEAYVPLKEIFGPGWVAALAGALSHTPKGCGFDSQSGHMPRLWVRSLVGACTGGTHTDVSLYLLLSLSSFLSKINKHILR